jgi:manganese oxidase
MFGIRSMMPSANRRRLPGRNRRRAAVAAAAAFVTGLAGCGSPPVTGVAGAPAADPAGQLRRYYLAADPVTWDYAPAGMNLITGEPFGEVENVFVAPGPDRIGRQYAKSVFREYTDDTFTTLRPRTAEWEHLGLLGPVIRAEVGDRVEVVLKNNTPFPVSLHAHGTRYAKDSEGAPYADGTSGADKADDEVPEGGTHTYVWEIPERAGPGPQDGSSIMWMYHSHVDEVADVYAGLMGPIVVTAKGMANPDGSPKDVDREFVVNFTVMDENSSPWLDTNIAGVGDPSSVIPDDEGFVESNLMHAINGFVYGNLPGLTMKKGERVRWYLMGMGTEVDLHTPHWHGNTVVAAGMRTDVVNLLPATMVVADMQPDAAGTWLFHCHVADHITAGMQALYDVQ